MGTIHQTRSSAATPQPVCSARHRRPKRITAPAVRSAVASSLKRPILCPRLGADRSRVSPLALAYATEQKKVERRFRSVTLLSVSGVSPTPLLLLLLLLLATQPLSGGGTPHNITAC